VALTGTLKDFGIAEILQLIGQQAKSGVLHLKSKDDVIHLAMSEGCVVNAEYVGRKANERLGNMLVRADLITPVQLERALEEQKRTLRRLGDVLVDLAMVSSKDLHQMTALQITETVYKLFRWKSGTYAFEPGAVEYDRETVTPLRAESVLMEGFRQVDEWPLIKRKITSTAMTFERLRELPSEVVQEKGRDDVDAAFDSFGGGGGEAKGEFASLGVNERKVYALAVPGRPVAKIVDVARLGEFEGCKALLNLVNLGVLHPIPPPKGRPALAMGPQSREWSVRIRHGAARLFGTLAIAAALAGLAYFVSERGSARTDASAEGPVGSGGAQRFLARYWLARLEGALEVYRLERGEYPASLQALVDDGLVTLRELRHPWSESYYYRKTEGGFVLLNPVE
jgi:hypothetical protein